MKSNTCVNCGQRLKKAPATSEYNWVGQSDKKESCMSGATEMPNGEWISNQDHCSESEWYV